MNQLRVLAWLGVASFLTPMSARAIPAFARRYQVTCVFCHDGFPKLNNMGQRFKERGFRFEKEDAFDVRAFFKSIPVVVRGEGNRTFVENGGAFNTGFVKGISAGNLGSRFSYWVDDAIAISSGDVSNTKPDNAWLRYEFKGGDNRTYAKAGRIELDLPFTQVRSPHLFPYEIYGANTGSETEQIGVHKDGLELGGNISDDFHWSAAVVQGHSDTLQGGSHFNPNVFLRAGERLGRDRVGVLAYFGTSTLTTFPRLQWDDHQFRLGADWNLWVDDLNVYGVYLHGHNSNSAADAVHPSGTGVGASFDGGFIQADYHPRPFVALTFRWSLLNEPFVGTVGPNETFSVVYPGIQIFIFEHGKASFEYGFQNRGRSGIGIVQIEFAL